MLFRSYLFLFPSHDRINSNDTTIDSIVRFINRNANQHNNQSFPNAKQKQIENDYEDWVEKYKKKKQNVDQYKDDIINQWNNEKPFGESKFKNDILNAVVARMNSNLTTKKNIINVMKSFNEITNKHDNFALYGSGNRIFMHFLEDAVSYELQTGNGYLYDLVISIGLIKIYDYDYDNDTSFKRFAKEINCTTYKDICNYYDVQWPVS